MKKDENFETLYEALQGDFNKYISDIKLYLKKRDSEYKSYLDSVAKIKEKNRKIDELASGKFQILPNLTSKICRKSFFCTIKSHKKKKKPSSTAELVTPFAFFAKWRVWKTERDEKIFSSLSLC